MILDIVYNQFSIDSFVDIFTVLLILASKLAKHFCEQMLIFLNAVQVSVTSAWRDWALWCASQPCVSPRETPAHCVWVFFFFHPDTLFSPDGSLNHVYSCIFFLTGISNSIIVCSNLYSLPYDHFC